MYEWKWKQIQVAVLGKSCVHGRMCWDEHESSITYRGVVQTIDRPHVELRPARFQIKDSLKEMQYGRRLIYVVV